MEKRAFAPMVLPYVYADMPGLSIREFTSADLEVIAPLLAYKDIETSRLAITTRMNDPFTQTLSWEFKGRLIQTESLRLKPDNSVEIGTAVHLTHRSAAFWREAERPIFKRLHKLGITTLSTLTLNSLLKYWKMIIEDHYKGKAGRVSPLTTQFTYPLDLTVFKGWPKRRTAGPDWRYEVEDTVFREMQPEELPTVLDEIRKMHRSGESVANHLDEKYTLDRASVLLGTKDGKLVTIRAIRQNSTNPNKGNYSIYNRMSAGREEKVARLVSNLWFQQLGYEKVVAFYTEMQKPTGVGSYVQSQDGLRITEFIDRGMLTYAVESTVADSIARGIR
jgi:hypothetical protein